MTDDVNNGSPTVTDADNHARILSFEPVIKAIDSANSSELEALARIGDTLNNVANALQQSTSSPKMDSGGLQIKRVKTPEPKNNHTVNLSDSSGDDSASQMVANPTKATKKDHMVDLNNHSGEKSVTVEVKNTPQKPKQDHIVNFNEPDRRNKNHLTVSGSKETPKENHIVENLGRYGDNAGANNETVESARKLSGALEELKGFYHDQRGRLRRPDGRFANKDERKQHAESARANKEAEERRRASPNDKPDNATTSVLMKLSGAITAATSGSVGTDNEVTDAAGSAVGNSYWKAATELYQVGKSAKELVVREKKDDDEQGNDKHQRSVTTSEPAPTPIGRANSMGTIKAVTPLEPQSRGAVLSNADKPYRPGDKIATKKGAAGSITAKNKATAIMGVKKTQEQTQVLKDNHAEIMDVLKDFLEQSKSSKGGGGILGSLMSAAGKGSIGELLAGGVGYGLWQKWKKHRAEKKAKKAAKKAEKEAKKREKARGAKGNDQDRTGIDLDFDRQEEGRERKGKRTQKNKRYGRRHHAGHKGRRSRLFSFMDDALEAGEEVSEAKNAISTGRKATKVGRAATATERAGGATAGRITGRTVATAERAGGATAGRVTGRATGAITKGAMVANEASEGASLLGGIGGKALKGGVKLLGGAAKVLGPLGMIASAGMSFADEDGQRAAFGLQDGEKVGMQKKLAYTAVDSLSMGGALFDASKMAGKGLSAIGLDNIGQKLQSFDESTATKALDQGISSLSDSFKGLFDQAKDKVNAVSVALTGNKLINTDGNQKLEKGVNNDSVDRRLAQYDPEYEAAGAKYGVNPALLKAMTRQESGGNPNAVSQAGAAGLMQLTAATAAENGVTDRFDPHQSIDGGAKYMASLLKRYNGDEKMALSAYNYGMGNIDKAKMATGGNSFEEIYSALPQETKNYAPAILAQKERYEATEQPATKADSNAAQQPVIPTTGEPAQASVAQPASINPTESTNTPAAVTKPTAAAPAIIPTTADIGATAKASDSNQPPVEVVAKSDPAMLNAITKGMDKVAKTIMESAQQSGAKPPATSTPAPRGKTPKSFGDAEMDNYMRDSY